MTVERVEARGRRYSTSVSEQARELAEGGWDLSGIVRVLHRRGYPVGQRAVERWISADRADRQREHDLASKRRRDARRSGGRFLGRERSPEFKLARIHALRELGLGATSVAKAMRLDFPDDELVPWMVDAYIYRDVVPRPYRDES